MSYFIKLCSDLGSFRQSSSVFFSMHVNSSKNVSWLEASLVGKATGCSGVCYYVCLCTHIVKEELLQKLDCFFVA